MALLVHNRSCFCDYCTDLVRGGAWGTCFVSRGVRYKAVRGAVGAPGGGVRGVRLGEACGIVYRGTRDCSSHVSVCGEQ